MPDHDPLARFRTQLMQHLATRGPVALPRPLPVSPWVAMSLLQKSIRRGRTPLALAAAATLAQIAPDRLWRRLGGIAHEDVGTADLPVLGLVSAALSGKRFRKAMGGDWSVASVVVEALCRARKSRASDDLLMTLIAHPGYAEQRRELALMPNSRLRLVALTAPSLHTRALAVIYLLGTDRPGASFPAHRGEPALAFDVLDELGVAPTTLALCGQAHTKTGEALPALVALLSLENGLRRDTVDDPIPAEMMAGPAPGWALDMFTHEGKQALARLLQTSAGAAAFAVEHFPPARRIRFLGELLFRVEGGLLAQRLGGDLSNRLRAQMVFESLGVSPEDAVIALDLMREDLPILNRIRATIMQGQRHVE